MYSIEELSSRVQEIGNTIDAPRSLLMVRNTPTADGQAYIEIKRDGYHYVISERGQEFSREVINSDDEILYKIFSDIVFEMAIKYELKNRLDGQDFRRILFGKEVELMNQISSNWGRRKTIEIEETLRNSPYSDEEKKHQSLLGKIKNKLLGN